VLGQVRRTQRYAFTEPDEETVLVAHVVSLAPFRVLSHRDGIVDFDDFPPTASLM
jgi:hypothetical protein